MYLNLEGLSAFFLIGWGSKGAKGRYRLLTPSLVCWLEEVGGGGILKGAFQILISLLKGMMILFVFSLVRCLLSYYYFTKSKNLLISR